MGQADDALAAALKVASLADTLLRIARGQSPRGSRGYTEEMLLRSAERCRTLFMGTGKPADSVRFSCLPAIHPVAEILPHQNLPIENPPIQVGGVYGGNYHDAMIRLGLAIDGDLLRAEAFSRLEAAQDRREAGFSDWWKFAAQMLCDRPLLDFELIEVCLKSESRQAAELLRESDDSPAEAVPPSAGDDLNKPTKLMNAMTILVSNQLLAGRPMTEIAEKVGVSRQTLYSKTWKPFRDTIETMKNTLPRGSKDKDGNVEAEWSDV